ncbi:MAG: AmmeMemoRadiSam system radical SAM enzyme [Deltaproteobacteria bacterium]|nr:AmmeMemoRadiSam system radical SAM enzyme [Deltaproteobacteria bacterium]MBW2020289.1 AmmeMemoRadiSam system radical SAM enzyme [Deltaproteobacteria bacterium]MBW2074772.1 AmmeMemoRadiSam system radical SAM enzyme [Deltaproteobacteria bacterium]
MSISLTGKSCSSGRGFKTTHETVLFQPLEDQRIQCLICQRCCKIAPGKTGYCKTRKHINGKLYSLIYGQVSSMRISPIEIKPLFHFYPGSRWLSLGSLGCNFLCPGCQNWEIAHADIETDLPATQYVSPEKAVQLALEGNCHGISWTYNEPTIWFEYTLDSARMAKDSGLLTNYVTNGYITQEALDLLGPYLDAFRVDLKGFSSRAYRRIAHIPDFQGILQNIQRAKDQWGMHIEIVTNLIPGFNDHEDDLHQMARWIVDHLGSETPWHVTRFFPHLKLSHLSPTPISKLESARKIGMDEGLTYVYLGNCPGHGAENTYCPGCGKLLIERDNFEILQYHLKGSKCEYCDQQIAGSFEP